MSTDRSFESFIQRVNDELVEALSDPERIEADLAEVKRRAAALCPSRYIIEPDGILMVCELEAGHPGMHREGGRKWTVVEPS